MSKEEIARLYKEAGEFNERARGILNEYTGKEMPQEKSNEVDTLFDKFDEFTERAKRLERGEAQRNELSQPVGRLGAGGKGRSEEEGKEGRSVEQRAAWNRYLKRGAGALSRAEMAMFLPANEQRALQADDDEAGGFLVAPQEFAQGLLKFVDDRVAIRQYATVEQLTQAVSLGIVSMDEDFTDFTWTTELQTGSADTVKPFGKRVLTPHPLAKRVKVSRSLIRKSTRPVDTIVRQRLGYKQAATLESAYMTGNGDKKPLGLFTASDLGIPTSRDTTAASATVFTADEILDAKFALKEQYQNSPTTRWIVSREFVKRARKFKDGQGQYLWGMGLNSGSPNTIADVPYIMSEFAPSTFSTGRYVALIGDLQFYYIVDSLALEIRVLEELYAETDEIGYISRYEGDGAPVLAEAFQRLKLA